MIYTCNIIAIILFSKRNSVVASPFNIKSKNRVRLNCEKDGCTKVKIDNVPKQSYVYNGYGISVLIPCLSFRFL